MRVLLVEPPKAPATFGGGDVFLHEPLALEYLASGVAGDHEAAVKILHDLEIEIYASFIVRPDFCGEDFAALKNYCAAPPARAATALSAAGLDSAHGEE